MIFFWVIVLLLRNRLSGRWRSLVMRIEELIHGSLKRFFRVRRNILRCLWERFSMFRRRIGLCNVKGINRLCFLGVRRCLFGDNCRRLLLEELLTLKLTLSFGKLCTISLVFLQICWEFSLSLLLWGWMLPILNLLQGCCLGRAPR